MNTMTPFKKRGVYGIDVNQTLRSLFGGASGRAWPDTGILNPVTGQLYMPAAMAMVFERACQHAGVPHATCHDLRHPFVTKARGAGIDDFRRPRLMGAP